MAVNILQAVQTYQKSGNAILNNMFAFINTFNKKFNNFQNFNGNLGSTVTFDLPPRFKSNDGLIVASFDGTEQRVQSLTVDQSRNINFDFTAQEMIFNIDNNNYMPEFIRSSVEELGSFIEAQVASVIPEGTYRYFGTPTAPISSYGDLAQAVANYKAFGAPGGKLMGYLDTVRVPQIVNTGFSSFLMERNNEAVNSWMVGDYQTASWMQSNLLPLHLAGNVGNDGTTLTVVSIDVTGTILTFSGASATDADAIKANDVFTFQDGVSGQPNIRFLTFTGHQPTSLPVQFRATADAASNGGGQVTVTIEPALIPSSANSRNSNTNFAVAAGMQVKGIGDHRCGMLIGDKAAYLAMPQLPDQRPYDTAYKADPESGAGLRLTTGAVLGQNQYGSIFDAIWGRTIARDYAMRLIFAP